MVLFLEGKGPRRVLAACLVLSTMGIFTFATVEPLRSVDFWAEKPDSGALFAPVDLEVGCLAEGGAMLGNARGPSFFTLRVGFLRFLAFDGPQNALAIRVQSHLRAIEKFPYSSAENSVPIKLLI